MTEPNLPEQIPETDFVLCEFENQCQSCLHYGAIYFGNGCYFDSRDGDYHCHACVMAVVEDNARMVIEDEDDAR